MKRKQAFAQIRKHIGDLTCDRIREAAWELRLTGRHHEADRIEQASTVTHQLRSALAAMMVIASTPDIKTCPNCKESMDDHGPNCIVQELLALHHSPPINQNTYPRTTDGHLPVSPAETRTRRDS